MEKNKIIPMNNKLNIPVIYDHVNKDKIFIPFSILNRNNINNGNYIYIYENTLNGKYYLKIVYRTLPRFKLYGISLSFK